MDTIGKACSLCRNTVSKAISELDNDGFIDIVKKRPKGSRYTCNYYVLPMACPPFEQSNEQSIDQSNERSPDAHKPIEPIEPIEELATDEILLWKEESIPDSWLKVGLDRKIPKENVLISWEKFKDHMEKDGAFPFPHNRWVGWIKRERNVA